MTRPTRVATLLALTAILAVVPVLAQDAGETCPVIVITLKISGDQVEVASAEKDEGAFTEYHGVAQLAPMFFEITGSSGEVLFAAPVADPKDAARDVDDGTDAKTAQNASKRTMRIVVPADDGAKEFTLFRRISDDPETGRKVLARAKL